MKAIKEIISESEYGTVEQMDPGDSIKIDGGTFMDLTIEKVADEKLSVAHYYTQRGDLMSDPEIVFRIDGDDWVPVRYTVHPGIHQHDEEGLPEVKRFSEAWSDNIVAHGFLEKISESDK